jgi:ABC-2 type transport system permease protein
VLAMVKGILTQHVMQNVSAEMFGGAGGQKLMNDNIALLEKEATSNPRSAELQDFLKSVRTFQTRNAAAKAADAGAAQPEHPVGLSMPFVTTDQAMSAGPKYNGYAHAFAGMAVQFILFMGIDAGIGVLTAQRQGLWNRLLASPITLNTVLAARATSSALIAFCLLLFIFVVAGLFFQVQIAGSVWGFLGVGLCFALVTATFGLLIAAFGKTPEAARGMATFATLIMVMLGGAWIPSFLFPQWLQSLTLAVPTRWAVDGLDAMTWRGLSLDAAWGPMLAQLGFAALFGALALWKFSRQGNGTRA